MKWISTARKLITWNFKIIGEDNHLYKLYIDNNRIDKVISYKYLGVIIDTNLKYNLHIKEIVRKIKPMVASLNKAKYILKDTELKKNIQCNYISSYHKLHYYMG